MIILFSMDAFKGYGKKHLVLQNISILNKCSSFKRSINK